MSLGPFDLSGGPFLSLYAALFVLAWFASNWLSQRLRPEGQFSGSLTPEEMAVLAGDLPRHSEVVAADLLSTGQLIVRGKKELAVAADASGSATVRSLRALPSPLRWPAVERALRDSGRSIRARLVARGLLMQDHALWQLRLVRAMPFLLLAGFGLIKLMIGEARGRPVGFLALALIATILIAVIRFVGTDRRTLAGSATLEEARARHSRLRLAPTAGEAALGVALFGTAVLVGSGWEALHRLRTASGDSGAGSSSACGGGGCGGGGCGGCSS